MIEKNLKKMSRYYEKKETYLNEWKKRHFGKHAQFFFFTNPRKKNHPTKKGFEYPDWRNYEKNFENHAPRKERRKIETKKNPKLQCA